MNITDLNTANDYDNITDNCTNNENNSDMFIPTLLTIQFHVVYHFYV